MGGDGDNIQVILDKLAQLAGQPPPPGITPDPLAEGRAYISQLLKVLGIASNSGDPADLAAAQAGYDERGLKTGDARTKFPANEAESSAKMAGVGSQNEMAQMVQQMASGLAGSLSGALGGFLQPLGQISQQVAQIGQQAMQAAMGGLQHGAGAAAGVGEAIPGELLGATSGAGELGGGGGGVGAGGLGATTPTAMLGPLPGPSAGTEPASAHTTSPPPANTSARPPRQGVQWARCR